MPEIKQRVRGGTRIQIQKRGSPLGPGGLYKEMRRGTRANRLNSQTFSVLGLFGPNDQGPQEASPHGSLHPTLKTICLKAKTLGLGDSSSAEDFRGHHPGPRHGTPTSWAFSLCLHTFPVPTAEAQGDINPGVQRKATHLSQIT